MHPQRILHPTDYQETSRPALQEAVGLARHFQARLVLLHVVDSLGPEGLTFGESVSAGQPEAMRRRLFEEMRRLLPPDAQVHVDYVLSEESVVTAILRAQAEHRCDLVVLGTHAESGFRHWLAGSLAEEVIRRAPCPVLVVKGPRAPEPLPELHASPLHPGRVTRSDD